jgi:hypothetical protein
MMIPLTSERIRLETDALSKGGGLLVILARTAIERFFNLVESLADGPRYR